MLLFNRSKNTVELPWFQIGIFQVRASKDLDSIMLDIKALMPNILAIQRSMCHTSINHFSIQLLHEQIIFLRYTGTSGWRRGPPIDDRGCRLMGPTQPRLEDPAHSITGPPLILQPRALMEWAPLHPSPKDPTRPISAIPPPK